LESNSRFSFKNPKNQKIGKNNINTTKRSAKMPDQGLIVTTSMEEGKRRAGTIQVWTYEASYRN
jgi:hypothetical protein